jgi:hypothetical protein
MTYWNVIEFSNLVGKTLTEITGKVGEDEIVFITDSGDKYKLYHYQDCCEGVYIEDICGDLSDLIGSPILLAEEVVSDTDPDGYVNNDEYRESFTWTFYKLSTMKGSVIIRWYGESNGYYSEGVDFVFLGKEDD